MQTSEKTTPPDLASNPLYTLGAFPAFSEIVPPHIAPAITALLSIAEQALDDACSPNIEADWQSMGKTLDTALERLGRTWGVVSHLNSVSDTPAWRAAYNQELAKISGFYAKLGASDALYQKYKTLNTENLDSTQKQALHNKLRDAVLSGAALKGENKVRFIEIEEKLTALSQKFHENVMDASDSFSYYARLDELDGVPSDTLASAQSAAQSSAVEAERTLYKLSLKLPIYQPIMQYAKSSALREKLYRAYVSRASELDGGAQDNTQTMHEILRLRHEQARLLGFADYAHASLASKMADNPNQVLTFLRDLAQSARPYALKDVEEMRNFAAEQLGIDNPQAWDWTYISERLKEQRYAFSDTEVKQYFTLPKVLEGLFQLVESLFKVRFISDSRETWHPDVRFFRVEREGSTIAHFYLDPTAREGKQNGAWMDSARARWLRPDTQELQTPIAYLVCNYAAGLNGKPALLTHDDVITLFHEMGHGLHHMLTQVKELDVSGISGVEWDAVELPSQFMENFAWEWPVLSQLSGHIDTCEPLPKALFDKMLAAKNFQSGLATLRQVEFSLFDMLLHSAGQICTDAPDTPPQFKSALDLQKSVHHEVGILPLLDCNRSANSFGHIFSGGYAAGYYSYKWAEVLSADAYSALEESQTNDGVHSTTTSSAFLHEILEVGGARPAMASFIAFRKRKPDIQALLRHQGMVAHP